MPATITLTVVQGKLQGKEFVFDERTSCIVGRADDCSPMLPSDEDHNTISRHHCLLDINPPDIRVRDFGSLNGTYVNGNKIGQRARGQTPEEGARMEFPEYDLKANDAIELGDTVFQVSVFVPAVCAACAAEIAEEQKNVSAKGAGVYLCTACREKSPATTGPPHVPSKNKVCAQCGRDVAEEIGAHRQGDFVCGNCRKNVAAILARLLESSSSDDDELLAVRGYTVLEEIGHGGMGAVFLARHERSGEVVALKVMLPRIAASEHAKQLFLREADNTKALQHPNVVRLRDAGCSQGTFFFTLDYCDGGSVDKLLERRGGPLPVAEALAIALQALDGLEYAHNVFGPGNGLVHRDLKPSNLLLSGSGPARIAKIGDYGLGKAFDLAGLSGQTRSGAVLGTPSFMPRQQVVNFKYAKPEVDVWALAASLYCMLTCRPPRDFPRGKDPWMAVLQSNAAPIRQRDASIPKELAEVIDLALVDNPKIHFQSAADLKRALERARI